MLPQLVPTGKRTLREVRVGDLTLQCRRDADCEKLGGRWNELLNRVADSTPFQSPHWVCPLLVYLQRLGRLRLITVARGQQLLGVVPLEACWRHRLRTTGALLSDYLDPLIDPAEEQLVWRTIFKNINELVGTEVRELILHNISPEFMQHGGMKDVAAELNLHMQDEVAEPITRISLASTWDEYLAARGSHDRKELRRKLRKAEAAGAKLECCTDESKVGGELTALFELMSKGGGGKGRKARWMFPGHFAAAAGPLLKQGRIRVYRLTIQGRYASGMIAFPAAHGEILWCGAFDPAMHEFSPGIVTFAMLIRQAIERGDKVMDMLRGDNEYKYRLGAEDHPLYRRTIQFGG
ncbi:MAG TPA: GNAT family N-acetyltransferase [Tepidisphaeraceae bacterium]|jgi:CelD/BcsL family acetyltransferase involved in cellulose biosynthesis|nr:GNAT family N-acetyltransferase [Tepidisphaeraceae bacterium]